MYSTGVDAKASAVADGMATINPAALSDRAASSTVATPDTTPRGIKRGHALDNTSFSDQGTFNNDDSGPRKRRPMAAPRRSGGVPESPSATAFVPNSAFPPQTPQAQTTPLPSQNMTGTANQSSPPKTTPKSVIKALPTVRDHTTDQLAPEGDEYVPREFDDAGEKKINGTGHLTGGREYKCRTFFVPNRGSKLFMLATECARVLGYRDSYLLFNKNRSLYKIIATQAEKEDLIRQEVLPFSYRSRQIAIVTAKSMFRQFGSRVIVDGRRVRDDYWEQKARKQGFTEDDLAGEKRPGAAKAREAQQSAEAAMSAASLMLHPPDIMYSTATQFAPHAQTQIYGDMPGSQQGPPLPMITLGPEQSDSRPGLGDYRAVQRPRQSMTGVPYQDRTQPSGLNDLMTQAGLAADYNKQISQQRHLRGQWMNEMWHKPHDPPPGSGGALATPLEARSAAPGTTQSPGIRSPSAAPNQSGTQALMSGSSFNQNTLPQQSPMRSLAQTHASSRSDQSRLQRSPSLALSTTGSMVQGAGAGSGNYAFQQNQVWGGQQQSPQSYNNYQNHHSGQMSPGAMLQQHTPSQQTPRHSGFPGMQPPGQQQYLGQQGMAQQGYQPQGRGYDPNQQFSTQNTPPPQGGYASGQQQWGSWPQQ